MAAQNRTAKKRAFLAAYAESGIIGEAAEAVGFDRRRHYEWLEDDPEYARAFKAAGEAAADLLETEAKRRAIEGVRRMKFARNGDPLINPETGNPYIEHEYSDTLLIFLLKGIRPEKYRENIRQEVVGEDGGPVQVELTTSELLRKVAEIGAKVGLEAKGDPPCSTPS